MACLIHIVLIHVTTSLLLITFVVLVRITRTFQTQGDLVILYCCLS